MNVRILAVFAVLITLLLASTPAPALSMNQFVRICASAEVACSQHPVLNAYVGGALDLIAMLDEETEYMAEIYCKPTKELFDVETIIVYMESMQEEYGDRNAMLVLIRYLEENGGC